MRHFVNCKVLRRLLRLPTQCFAVSTPPHPRPPSSCYYRRNSLQRAASSLLPLAAWCASRRATAPTPASPALTWSASCSPSRAPPTQALSRAARCVCPSSCTSEWTWCGGACRLLGWYGACALGLSDDACCIDACVGVALGCRGITCCFLKLPATRRQTPGRHTCLQGRLCKPVTHAVITTDLTPCHTRPTPPHTWCLRRSAAAFRHPEDLSTPLIMVGPGTGVGAFRAFLQQRRAMLSAAFPGGLPEGEVRRGRRHGREKGVGGRVRMVKTAGEDRRGRQGKARQAWAGGERGRAKVQVKDGEGGVEVTYL